MHKKRWLVGSGIVLIVGLVIAVVAVAYARHETPRKIVRTRTRVNQQKSAPKPFDKQQYSLTDPTSIWVVINKSRPLDPRDYAPADLVMPTAALSSPGKESMQIRAEAAKGMEAMFAAAQTAGVPLMVASSYRSYAYQVSVYDGYVAHDGVEKTDVYSARPGYSEHQTGLAFDVEPLDGTCNLDVCFAGTPAGQWMAKNSYRYGFILRYPKDKTAVTGYQYEPWHFRYVGTVLATELHDRNIETLEEFFGLPAAPTYTQQP